MRCLSRLALGLLLAAEAILMAMAVQDTYNERQVLYYESAALVVFVAAITLLARSAMRSRIARWVVLGFGAVLQLIAIRRPPVDSDDDFRYLWDGKVQLAGIDPYRYAPSSPALNSVRDNYLFPAGACGHYPLPGGGCTRINLPTVQTIYPPVAEGFFALVRIISFGYGDQFPLQAAAAVGTLAVAFLLARRGRPMWTVALWAWCPVTVIELGNNAHVDWLAVLLGVLALTASARGRTVAAGVLLGAGFATKLYPGLLGVTMLKRRPWLVVAAAVSTVVVAYLPHVFAVGTSVIGYLPTYLDQGGYGNGHQYRLLALVLPTVARAPVALLIVVVTIGWAMLRSDPDHPERSALIVIGTSILVATPTLPWYTVLLLALAAIAARPEWLGVVVAPTVEYLLVGVERVKLDDATALCYLAGLLILLAGTGVRHSIRILPFSGPQISKSSQGVVNTRA